MYRVIREKYSKRLDRERFLEECCESTKAIVEQLTRFANVKSYETETFKDLTKAFSQSYYAIRKPISYANEYRERVCEHVISKSLTTFLLGTLYHDLVELGITGEGSFLELETNNSFLTPLLNLQTALFNYLDATPVLGRKLVLCEVYMESVRNVLTKLFNPIKENRASKDLKLLVEYTIAGVYNALRHEDSDIMEKVIELKLIDIVRPYANCDDPTIQMAAYMFLAYTESEKNALELRETRTIEIFIDCLDTATKNVYKRGRGYSVLELAKAIRILAQNDANKRVLVQKGILSCLKKMLESGKADEEEEALLTLWTLSFDSENKKQIEQELGDVLHSVQHKLYTVDTSHTLSKETAEIALNLTANDEFSAQEGNQELEHEEEADAVITHEKRKNVAAKKALKGLIWELGSSEMKPSAEEQVSTTKPTGQHVMISYNHQHKHIASEIAFRLRQNGFEVWIDLDNMRSAEDVMEGMAKAVEKSFLVLILFSKAYKDSPNTRSEAQYAYHMKKPLLFLRVQPAYRPDGWLGIMLGARIYLDFSGKYPFEKKFEELLFSINKTTNLASENLGSDITTGYVQPMQATNKSDSEPKDKEILTGKYEKTPEPSFATWDEEETSKWLNQWNAEWFIWNYRRKYGNGEETLTGSHLVFLSKLEKESPSFFYEKLVQFGGMSNLTMLMKFTTALHELPS